MNIEGKKLLLMGGSAFSQSLRKYADEKGFKMVAVGNVADSPYKKVADVSYMIDTQNVEEVIEIARKEKCDGVFPGANEANIASAIEVAKALNINFYTDMPLWKRLSNKAMFKSILEQHGVDTTKSYTLKREEIEKRTGNVTFPVIVKPVDGSGANGIGVCNDYNELLAAYDRACMFSDSGEAIIEKFITGLKDMFIHYTIIDGRFSLTATFDRNCDFSNGGFSGMPLGYNYPSIYTKQYIDKINDKVVAALTDAGIKNGAINIQCFTDGEKFYFYESGYRLGGEQMYFFTEKLTGNSVFKMIVNQALTGKMEESSSVLDKDNVFFTKPCLSLYIPLRAGIITKIEGVDKIRKMPGVLNVTEMCGVGTKICADGSLGQVCLRMHLMEDNVDKLAVLVDSVYDNLNITDENGNDMVMKRFDLRTTDYYRMYK